MKSQSCLLPPPGPSHRVPSQNGVVFLTIPMVLRMSQKTHCCDFSYAVVQPLTHVQLFATPWTAAHFPVLHHLPSLLRLMSTESVMPSKHLILCHPLSLLPSIFPSSGSFLMSWLFTSGGQSTGASASASVLPMNIQGWFPIGLTGLISLLSKGLSKIFSNTTVRKHHFYGFYFYFWCYTWAFSSCSAQPSHCCDSVLFLIMGPRAPMLSSCCVRALMPWGM